MEGLSNPLNNQFLDEDDALYQMLTEDEFDDEEADTSSDDEKDFEYKVTSETNLYRFLKTELQLIEPSRRNIRFRRFSDSDDKKIYEGKVLKEVDKDFFIFLLEKPEKKMKKFDINDLEVLV